MEELEIEKINEAIAIISKEILLSYVLRYVCQSIKQAREKENIFKDAMIKKELYEKVDT